MSVQFAAMDQWSSDQVALFKGMARNKQAGRPSAGAATALLAAAAAGPLAAAGAGAGPGAGPPADLGTIVAEGDSWFDYLPGTDVIDCLRNHHDCDIDNYGRAGDTLENMIYGTGISRSFERVSTSIDRVLLQIQLIQPKIFLFSGGGNDVAGDEFESFLNHKGSGLPVLRAAFVQHMVHTVFRKYFEDLIQKVHAVSPGTHVVVHGYGHTVPTGQGVSLWLFSFAGPWLRPALARKGIFDPIQQRDAVTTLIDEYNAMLKALDTAHLMFHHVDLRNLIQPADWVNELHLGNSSFARVAQRIHDVMQGL